MQKLPGHRQMDSTPVGNTWLVKWAAANPESDNGKQPSYYAKEISDNRQDTEQHQAVNIT